MRTIKEQISLCIRGLIGTSVVRCLDSKISLLAIAEISRLAKLVSEAEQAGLCLTWLKMPKTGFLMMWLIIRGK